MAKKSDPNLLMRVPSDSSDKVWEVRRARAKNGQQSGLWYLTCNCPGGRFAWKSTGFRACKHMTVWLDHSETVLVAGHYN